jgi:uncharacterized phage protein gp47/JayE
MFTQAEISKRIRDQLYILDPEISLEIATPERKIIDIVAQSLADVQFDQFLQRYQLDIETKFGQDLDDFVQLFGFARQTARRASGFVIFSRKTPAVSPVFIPAGTQVATVSSSVSSQVLFTTVADGVIPENGTFTEVPVEATIPGEIGNVTANRITRILTQISDISSVNNPTSTTGGVEQETDDQLKVRFKNNIFRNIAGTDDQFLALSIANQFTNRSTIIGPVTKFQEYMTLDASGSATSFNPNAKHIYDFNYYLSNEGNDISRFYTPDIDYAFSVDTSGTAPLAQIGISDLRNPSPPLAPTAGTSDSEGFLQGNFRYAYTYVYSPGGESSISPESNEVTFNIEGGSVTNIKNTSGTSLAGGTVSAKRIYRKDLNVASPTWENVGEIPAVSAFQVTSISRDSGGVINAIVPGTANLSGVQIGGTVVVSGIATAVGTAFNGTGTVTSTGSATFSYYISGGGSVAGTAVTGTAIAEITAFHDDSIVAVGEPPTNDLSEGSVVFLEHEYLSKWSRNVINLASDYSSLNKIDIYISGQNTEIAEDVTSGPGNLIEDDDTSKYYYANYVRENTQTSPAVNNYFINLVWTPVRSLPSQLTINGNTYYLNDSNEDGNAYWLVKDVTDLRDSYRARDGIEISPSMGSAIQNSVFSIEYTFDKLPYLTNKILESHRQIGQDVLVHTARFRYFRINLIAIYNNGFVINEVNNTLANNFESFFNNQFFGAIIQLNDLVQVAYQTAGIDNIRFATSADDATYYGLEEVTATGEFIQRFDQDVLLEDIDLPILYSLGPNTQGTNSPVAPIQKTQNNWIV